MWDIVSTVLMWVAVVAVAFLIWVLIEVALTVRKARSTVADLKERLEPTLSHVEQITNSLEPAVNRIDPLIERAQLTVDTLNLELMQVDKILSDASDITGTANSAVHKVSDVAGAPKKIVTGAADKLRSAFGKKVDETRVESAIGDSDGRNLDTSEESNDPASAKAARKWAEDVASQSGAAAQSSADAPKSSAAASQPGAAASTEAGTSGSASAEADDAQAAEESQAAKDAKSADGSQDGAKADKVQKTKSGEDYFTSPTGGNDR